jgi:hypothetical protein
MNIFSDISQCNEVRGMNQSTEDLEAVPLMLSVV